MEIKVVRDILDANNTVAAQNRKRFADHGLFAVNIMSSPGSGKTTLLERSLPRLLPEHPTAVVVGDICTAKDAERLAVSGAPVVQINTEPFGGDCHLGANVVQAALADLDLAACELLIIENVGNLVCPAEFDVGESARVVVLSTTEGEDKPLKYPLMFRQCELAILNKIDLLPHLPYDKDAAIANIRAVHPGMPILEMSAHTGEGLDAWIHWLVSRGQPQP